MHHLIMSTTSSRGRLEMGAERLRKTFAASCCGVSAGLFILVVTEVGASSSQDGRLVAAGSKTGKTRSRSAAKWEVASILSWHMACTCNLVGFLVTCGPDKAVERTGGTFYRHNNTSNNSVFTASVTSATRSRDRVLSRCPPRIAMFHDVLIGMHTRLSSSVV